MIDENAAAASRFPGYRTESHIVRRETGDSCRIDLALPEGPPPEQGWPSVLLLDAAGCFGTCVEALVRMGRRPDATGVAPLVVIGLSTPGQVYDAAQRQRDFTSVRKDGRDIGGATAFLRFIEERVQPCAARAARLDAGRRTLFGHSLAGYFALWVLANHPRAFRNIAAISPSIWCDPEGLDEAFSAAALADRRVLIAVGAWEDALPPWQQGQPGATEAVARRRQRQMPARAEALATRLKTLFGDAGVSFRLLAEEDHGSIVSAAIPRMLRLASRA